MSARARAAALLQRAWYAPRPTPLARLLGPLASLFGAAAALRRAAYRRGVLRRDRVGVPVVVIGNLTVGGAGKTPLALALVEALRARGRRPGLVSRGYGRSTRDVREARPGASAAEVGDEASILAASGMPMFVGADRVAAARALIDAHPEVDVVVADDGLQHYALARDVEIAVIDAKRGFGNGRLLPAGPLREPASRLATVDALVRLVADAVAPIAAAGPTHRHAFTMRHEPQPWVNLGDPALAFDALVLADPRAVAIAGIGDPERFFDALRADGFRGRARAFPDHHAFRREDVAFDDASAILMTEKDAVKCRAFADARMWMQPIRARFDPALVDFVMERLDGPQAPRDAGLPRHEGPADP